MTISKLFIGLCMWDTEIIYKTNVIPEDLPEPESTIFKAMLDITREGERPDEGSIHIRTKIPFSDLFPYKDVEIASIAPNWMFYEKQIKEAIKNRLVRKRAEDIFKSEGMTSDEMVSMMMETIEQVQSQSSISTMKGMDEVVKETMSHIDERVKIKSKIVGIPTGLNNLDDFIQGLQNSKLYYIGGRPSQGKTALLLNFIANANRPVGVISAESPAKSLMIRMLAKNALVDSKRIDSGMFVMDEYEKVRESANNFMKRNIHIEDSSDITIGMIYGRALEMKRRWNIEALFVDYLQYIKPDKWMMSLKTHEQMAQISMQLKNIARKLEIPVIVASQLKRDSEGKRPVLSDLSDSTQLERDADVVVMIYNQYDENSNPTKSFLLVEKNRDGMTGVVSVSFVRQYMEFRDSQS